MNLLFFGPDRSGKTTIARAASDLFGLRYFKNGAESKMFAQNPKDFRAYVDITAPLTINILRQVHPDGLVLDRFTPCEYAYGHAFGRDVNDELIWWADQQLTDMDFFYVYCFKNEYVNWDDDPRKLERMLDIKRWYSSYISKSKMSGITLETSDENVDSQLVNILCAWETR